MGRIFLLQEMVQNLHNKSILTIIKGVFTLILMKMGNYRRVVYEKAGDLSPETRKGRKINHDLDILQADTRSRKKLLVFKEDNENLYTPKQAWNYLKEFKNLKDDKDLHKASYIAATQVILRFCRCYDGKINGKLLPTLSALKKFESKYPQYGKVKGPFSRETLLALEKYLVANEEYCKQKYKGKEVLNISVKELVQKQKKNQKTSNTSQSQSKSQISTSTSSSSSSSSSTTINSGSSSSSSTSGSSSSSSSSDSSNSSSSNTSSNETSTSSTSSNGKAVSQNVATIPNQPVEDKEKENQNVVQKTEQKTGNSVVQDSQTSNNLKTEKTENETSKTENPTNEGKNVSNQQEESPQLTEEKKKFNVTTVSLDEKFYKTPLFMYGVGRNFGDFLGVGQYEDIFKKWNPNISYQGKNINNFRNQTIDFPLIVEKYQDKIPQTVEEYKKKSPYTADEKLQNASQDLLVMKKIKDKFVLCFYKEGKLNLVTEVSPGTKELGITPSGVFSLGWKHANHKSQQYNQSPMPYAIHIQGAGEGGIYLHQGYSDGKPQSHGCIRVPGLYQKYLYEQIADNSNITIVIEDNTIPQST